MAYRAMSARDRERLLRSLRSLYRAHVGRWRETGPDGALFEAIAFAGGRILNGTLEQYRVPRFGDVPPIEIELLDRRDLPSAGAGETPIVCVAPAIGSAVRQLGAVSPALPVKLA